MASYSKKIAKNIQKSRLKCLLLILFSHWFVRMGLWNRMNGKKRKIIKLEEIIELKEKLKEKENLEV